MATQKKTKAPTVRKVKTSANGTAGGVNGQTVTLPPITNGHSSNGHPSEEVVRVLAYERFLARGCAHGDDLADWFAAESQLKA
ncbi:MAG: DUF2934 domain-containing protein [Candidatus Binataceae bacterium]|jgi:hypothetical protein